MKKAIETTQTIDHTSGEVLTETTIRRYRGDEPAYIKLYLQDIAYLHGLPITASDILTELLRYVTYGTQEIILNAPIKRRIAEATGMAVKTVDNRLQELVKKGIIDRVGAGIFVLNPYLFGKGDWKTIMELRNVNVHLQIIYDAKTGTRKLKGSTDEA